jgi:hypothetical protein
VAPHGANRAADARSNSSALLLAEDELRQRKGLIRYAAAVFGRLVPGELRRFEPHESGDARTWITVLIGVLKW